MEQESKPNPELQRVAEMLRPLWPGMALAGLAAALGLEVSDVAR